MRKAWPPRLSFFRVSLFPQVMYLGPVLSWARLTSFWYWASELRYSQVVPGFAPYDDFAHARITLLRELRHPNILQFLGSIVQGEDMILITEYLPKGNMNDILAKKVRLDPATCLRYALDIARGMNYLHEHKPRPIVHNNLHPRNLLLDEGDQVKIGEYWVQMLYERIHTNQDKSQLSNENLDGSYDTKKDIRSFGLIFYQMLEGKHITNMNSDYMHLKSIEFEKKFHISRCPGRILQLIEQCTSKDIRQRPSFGSVIEILEEVILLVKKAGCSVC
ncbi:hypothetical protein ABFX02_12G027600 [Erythranthe guttata]